MAGGKMQKRRQAPHQRFQGIEFQKSNGQHILKNPMIVQSIVQEAGIRSTVTVREIGLETGVIFISRCGLFLPPYTVSDSLMRLKILARMTV